MKRRYEKAHLLEAKYFLSDRKHWVRGEYGTNSHGKQIASASIKGQYDEVIRFTSYQDIVAARDMLEKIMQATRGKWIRKTTGNTSQEHTKKHARGGEQ